MHINLDWDDAAKTILHWDFEDGWTWVDYREAANYAAELIAQSPHPVHCVGDLHKSTIPPARDGAISYLRHSVENAPAQLGCVVIVNGQAFVNALMVIIERTHKTDTRRFMTANSMPEARSKLALHVKNCNCQLTPLSNHA